jgi:hypothetical protein
LYTFSLSQGLFSSQGIDTGSQLLLKVFSDFLDSARPPGCAPYSILDAGSGVGVLGICAAGALSDFIPPGALLVRAQDRDELARIFTEYNAKRNGFTAETFKAHTEPLLSGPPGWDIILTNIPAKAGIPVLEDFVHRSAALLKNDGRVFLLAVNTLADFFQSQFTKAGILLIKKETGRKHTVFVYNRADKTTEQSPEKFPLIFNEDFPKSYSFYIRNQNEYEMEKIRYCLDTVHGAPDFDQPGGAIKAAAKLSLKIDLAAKLAGWAAQTQSRLLVYDAGQGHFSLWLAHYLKAAGSEKYQWVLSGRNILALGAARAALTASMGLSGKNLSAILAADIFLDQERLAVNEGFALIAFFPETVPETDRQEADWEALAGLIAPGGIAIVGMSSAEAERFDRKKLPVFSRLGEIKRKGFRALAIRADRFPRTSG